MEEEYTGYRFQDGTAEVFKNGDKYYVAFIDQENPDMFNTIPYEWWGNSGWVRHREEQVWISDTEGWEPATTSVAYMLMRFHDPYL